VSVRPIYRTDGKWVAVLSDGHLFDTLGEWIAWLHGNEIYSLEGEYVGYLSQDSRILRARKYEPKPSLPVPPRPARIRVPSNIPLPPLFVELAYDTIDVFQESPDLFLLISERKPDSGEEQFEGKISRLSSPPTTPAAPLEQEPRLTHPPARERETPPVRKLPPRQPAVPAAAKPPEDVGGRAAPPVPLPTEALSEIEREILDQLVQNILDGLQVSEPPFPIEDLAAGRQPGGSGPVELASPEARVHLALQVVERMGLSPWIQQQGYCGQEGFSSAQVAYVARCLLMPEKWVRETPRRLKRDWAMARRFRVPEEMIHWRLAELKEK
jgi:hypothetical protein